jgi:hypothetical protein
MKITASGLTESIRDNVEPAHLTMIFLPDLRGGKKKKNYIRGSLAGCRGTWKA